MKKSVFSLMPLLLVLGLGSSQVIPPPSDSPGVRIMSDPAAQPIELMGKWPYGRCEACAIDASRNIALIGNGEALQVLDIANPALPAKIGEVALEGSPQDILIAGNTAYLVTLNYLIVADISDLVRPMILSSVFYGDFQSRNVAGSFRSIALLSGHVVAAADNGLAIFDVSDPRQPVQRANFGGTGFDVKDFAIWGKYAICIFDYWKIPEHPTRTYGVEVVDLSVLSAPRSIGTFELEKGYIPQEIEISSAGHAFVCQNSDPSGSGKLSIIDVATDPGRPTETGSYIKSGGGFGGTALAGNIAYLYLESPWRLLALDVSNPRSPVMIGECESNNGYRHMDRSGELIGVAHADSGFSLYNVASPGHPFRQAVYDTPDTLGGLGNGIVASGNYVYMACSNDGLRIMDVSDPSRPREIGLCKVKGLARGLAVSGMYAYGLGERLSIFDISSPSSPYLAADLDLPCAAPPCDWHDEMGIVVRAPYAYVSGTKWNGDTTRATLTIIDVSDPFKPGVVSQLVCAYRASHFGKPALSGDHIYLAVLDYPQETGDGRAGLRIIDISDAKNPKEVVIAVVPENSYGRNVLVRGNYAYLSGDKLRVIDISNPFSPFIVAQGNFRCHEIALSGDFAYLAWDKLMVVDISNIDRTPLLGYNWYQGEWGNGIAAQGNIAYVPGSLTVLENTSAPSARITAPSAQSTVLGTMSIEAQASHDSGIARIDFFIDGVFAAADSTAPFSYPWDTRPCRDGLHAIRVLAVNNNGKSSETEIDVFTRLVYSPLSFAAKTVPNRSLSQTEYVNVLSWQAHPENRNVAKYGIFLVDGRTQTLLAECRADQFEYWHRRIAKDKSYSYALVAVNSEGRESDPVYATVGGSSALR